MSLPHALLTSLLERPCSGLELARRFNRSIGHFWHATHQQIYRELGRLEEAGLVESIASESGRGGKKEYQVLPAGKAELKRWVGQGDEPRPMRDELMLRLRAEAIVGPTNIKQEVERHLAMHREKLALYRQLEARHFSDDNESREQELQHLVLTAGIMFEESRIAWCEQAIATLSRRKPESRAPRTCKRRGAA